jgi:hypothetical protein
MFIASKIRGVPRSHKNGEPGENRDLKQLHVRRGVWTPRLLQDELFLRFAAAGAGVQQFPENTMTLPSFEDYLSLLPADIVFKNVLGDAGHKRRILSSSLIHDAARLFAADKSLWARFKRLSPQAQRLCAAVYLAGAMGVPAPGLRGFSSDELLASFLVFAGKDEKGVAAYYGFSEFESKLALLCADALISVAGNKACAPTSAPMPWYCLSDLVMCATLASTGMLDRTKKGTFSKAAEVALRRFLHASRDLPAGEAAAEAGRAACISLVLSYAVSRELLAIENDAYLVAQDKLAEWVSLPLEARCGDFCEYAFAQGPLWRRPVMDKLFEGPTKPWLSTSGFPDAARRDAEASACALWYCGYLEVCKVGSGLVFSAARRQDILSLVKALPVARVILLPDFSAVLSQEILPEELYWFTKVGEVSSLDKVYKGIIKRDIINNSLSAGTDEKKLVDWLAAWKAPHNVMETVREWIREFSRVCVITHGCVVSFDEKASQQILSYAPLTNLVTPVRPHKIFMIRRGSEEEVRRILVTMGFDPRGPGENEPQKHRPALDLSPAEPRQITPVVSFEPDSEAPPRPVKAGKYGEKLKELDMSDLLHVLDYAVLMGHGATFEYLGSPYVRAGTYEVRPLAVHKAKEPFLEAEIGPKKSKKRFLLRKIKKIGVGAA